MSLFFRKNYAALIVLLLLVIIIGSILAPALMKTGSVTTSKFLYRQYSNLCHQFAHRSWFIFGEQYYYPAMFSGQRELLTTYDAFNIDYRDTQAARQIIGNERFGYKIAFCQRDFALYSGLALFCLVFHISGRKIKQIPFYMWILFAVLPLGLDGGLQYITSEELFTNLNFMHESTPLLRSITGGAFGIFTAWFLLPAIEETYADHAKDNQNKKCQSE